VNYAQQLRFQSGNRAGLAVVVLLHVLLGWALLNGLAKRAVDVILPPPVVEILPREKAPPPPPQDLPQPKSEQPPPVYVPVPEIPVTAREPEPTVTTHSDLPAHEPSPRTDGPTSDAATPPVVAPRIVAKPAIANVQGCAPRGEDYPAAARRAEATGVTRLRFTIDSAGALMKSEITKSAGVSREHRLLDKVAESKLASCYFTAGVDENGRPVGGTFEVDYVWKLE
jgi:protein TonB